MWVSTQTAAGDFGAVSAATQICETDAPGSLSGKTHRAVIATSSSHPKNYFANDPSVQRPDGTVISSSYADLFGSANIANSITGASGDFWAGSLTQPGDGNCQDWTTTSGSTNLGNTLAADVSRFANAGCPCNCSSSSKFLCMSY